MMNESIDAFLAAGRKPPVPSSIRSRRPVCQHMGDNPRKVPHQANINAAALERPTKYPAAMSINRARSALIEREKN